MVKGESVYEKVGGALEVLEGERLVFKRKERRFMGVVGILLVGMLMLGWVLHPIVHVSILFLLVVITGIVIAIMAHQMLGERKAQFLRRYKRLVVEAVLGEIDPELSYQVSSGISEGAFMESELFAEPDRYHTEDLVSGVYGKTELYYGEVHAEEERTRTDSEGNTETYYVTLFKGVFFIADFHKHFHGRTFIHPDKAERMLGSFGRKFQKLGGPRGTQLVQMDDPEFEEVFAIYSDDEVECRYLLSNALMRRFLDLESRLGKGMRVAFKNSSVYIAIPYRGKYLEPDVSVPATDPQQVERLVHQVTTFLYIVEELNLNTRIWSKK